MTRLCLAVAAVSAKKGGAASKIKKIMLDSKKAKRTAALQPVKQALGRGAECRPESPPRPRGPWQSGLALEPLLSPLPRVGTMRQPPDCQRFNTADPGRGAGQHRGW